MEKLKPGPTLSEQAYLIIKDSIIKNKFKPDEILAEERLAKDLGISRTPIKAALSQLAYEGLVTMESGRRARVSVLSEKDALNIQLIRERLEPLAANIAASKVNQTKLNTLKAICDRQSQSIVDGDILLFLELDSQFHTCISELSENENLNEFIKILNNRFQRFLSSSLPDSVKGSIVEEHIKIIEALSSNNPSAAEREMQFHLQNVTERILSRINKNDKKN